MHPTDTMRALRAWQKRKGAENNTIDYECNGDDIAGRQVIFNAAYRPHRGPITSARFQPCVPDFFLINGGRHG